MAKGGAPDPISGAAQDRTKGALEPVSLIDRRLFDRVLFHQIGLLTFRRAATAALRRILSTVDRGLTSLLRQRVPVVASDRSESELARLTDDVTLLHRASIVPSVQRLVEEHRREVVERELAWWHRILRRFALDRSDDVIMTDTETVLNFVRTGHFPANNPFSLEQHLANFEAASLRVIREALVEMLTLEINPLDILRRLIGSDQAQFRGSLLRRRQNWITAIGATASGHAAEISQREVMRENESLIGGEVWISILDDVTSLICQLLSMQVFPPGRGPYPPAHIHCRSKRVPFFRGHRPHTNTYGEWLRRQSAAIQDKVLGKARGEWFRSHPDAELREAWAQKFIPREGLTKRQIVAMTYGDLESQFDDADVGREPVESLLDVEGLIPEVPDIDIDKAKKRLRRLGVRVGTTAGGWDFAYIWAGRKPGDLTAGQRDYDHFGRAASEDFQKRVMAALERIVDREDIREVLKSTHVLIARADPDKKGNAMAIDTRGDRGLILVFEEGRGVLGSYPMDIPRPNVHMTFEDPVLGTLLHEIGHRALRDGFAGQPAKVYQERLGQLAGENLFGPNRRAVEEAVSFYAASGDPQEFGAELFAVFADPDTDRWPLTARILALRLFAPEVLENL